MFWTLSFMRVASFSLNHFRDNVQCSAVLCLGQSRYPKPGPMVKNPSEPNQDPPESDLEPEPEPLKAMGQF